MCVFVWRIHQSSPSEKSQSVYTFKKTPQTNHWEVVFKQETDWHPEPYKRGHRHQSIATCTAIFERGPRACSWCPGAYAARTYCKSLLSMAIPTTGCLFVSASRFQTYSVCVFCFCPWRCFNHVQPLFLVFRKHVFRTADDFWNKWLSLYLCDFFWFFPRCMPLLVSTTYLLMFDIVAIAVRLYRLWHYNFVIYSIICPYGLVPVRFQRFRDLTVW